MQLLQITNKKGKKKSTAYDFEEQSFKDQDFIE